MKFTNEDLKRLKEENGKPAIWFGDAIGKYGNIYRVILETKDVSALVARLEAAEACMSYVGHDNCDSRDVERLLETWKESKGEL
jgi:hypothetical protein